MNAPSVSRSTRESPFLIKSKIINFLRPFFWVVTHHSVTYSNPQSICESGGKDAGSLFDENVR